MSLSQERMRDDMRERNRAFWKARQSVKRIKDHLALLNNPSTSLTERLNHWRCLIDLAHQGFEAEVQTMDSVNAVVADPALTSAFGVPVE